MWSDSRIWRLAAAIVAAFVVYGSLVPFDLAWPAGADAVVWLRQVDFISWWEISRTDVLVNLAVGALFGFVFMGALRAERPSHRLHDAMAVLVVAGVSAGLAAAVELVQVLSAVRKSTWNDVMAQALGAAAGAVTWRWTGARTLGWARSVAGERELSGFTARVLQLYLPMYLVLQLTPFDSVRAAALAAGSAEAGAGTLGASLRGMAGSVLLNVPIGALAVVGWTRNQTGRSAGRAVVLGLAMVSAVALAQRVLPWRETSLVTIIGEAAGVLIGVACAGGAARRLWRAAVGSRRRPLLLAATAAWMLVLAGHKWLPPDVDVPPRIHSETRIRASLVPFASYRLYVANPLHAVHQGVLEFLLAVPLGVLVRLAWRGRGEPDVRRRYGVGVLAGAILGLAAIEAGQMFVPGRFPDVTDVLIGFAGVAAGAAVGTAIAARRMTVAEERADGAAAVGRRTIEELGEQELQNARVHRY